MVIQIIDIVSICCTVIIAGVLIYANQSKNNRYQYTPPKHQYIPPRPRIETRKRQEPKDEFQILESDEEPKNINNQHIPPRLRIETRERQEPKNEFKISEIEPYIEPEKPKKPKLCSLCHQVLDEKRVLSTLGCGDTFHYECLDDLIYSNNHDTCPLCMAPIRM